MTSKTNAQPTNAKNCENNAVLAPSLKSFVQLVKKSLTSKTKNTVKPSEMIKNVELLEQKMSGESGRKPCTNCSVMGMCFYLTQFCIIGLFWRQASPNRMLRELI